MDASTPRSALPTPDRLPIRVVVIYENRDAALRAKVALDHVADFLQDEFALETGAWSFGMFRAPQLSDIVMREAREANLLMIAVEGQSAIPPEVMNGIRGGNPPALALLANPCDNENARLPVIRSQLQRLAREKSIDVLFEDLSPDMESGEREARAFRQIAQPPLPAFEASFELPRVDGRWGINE